MKETQQICDTYPTFDALRILGGAQCLLGRHEEAIESLEEAQRVEKIAYGYPDLPPYIEGFLALAYAGAGDLEKALAFQKQFNQESLQTDNKQTKKLNKRIQFAIDNLVASEKSAGRDPDIKTRK